MEETRITGSARAAQEETNRPAEHTPPEESARAGTEPHGTPQDFTGTEEGNAGENGSGDGNAGEMTGSVEAAVSVTAKKPEPTEENIAREKKEKRRQKLKRWLGRILALLFVLLGIILLSYPWISNYLYENRAVSEINTYTETVEEMDESDIEAEIAAAKEYNDALREDQSRLIDPFDESELDQSYADDYWDLLDVNGSGLMGYIDIPCISVYLPVYHGTEENTLLAGVGHMQGSSLPVGGSEGTHTVITGHSGLSSAKMFTDLDQLEVGDYFYFHLYDQILVYQVVSVNITLPNDVSKLRIEEGQDLMTLVTCTPYGINSHRLLVTGTRVEYTEELYEASQEEKKSAAESAWMKSYTRAVIIGMVISLLLFVLILLLHWFFCKAQGEKTRERK